MLAIGLVFSFAACAKDKNANETENEEALTLGGKLKKQFVEIVKGGETDPETIANTLMENELIQFAPMVQSIDPGVYIQGFNEGFEPEGYDECVMFGPMIGSIPFIGYIFALSDGVDAEEFVKGISENSDLRWNICTSADEVNASNEGNLVFFLMSPLSLEQDAPEENMDEAADEPIDEIPMDEPAAMPEE